MRAIRVAVATRIAVAWLLLCGQATASGPQSEPSYAAVPQGGDGSSLTVPLPSSAITALQLWLETDGAVVPLDCTSNPAAATANATMLLAAINATLLSGPEHRRYLNRLPPGRCYVAAGVITIADIEGGTALTRGKFRLEGAGKDNTELMFTGSGDGILIKSGKTAISDLTITSDGTTRGFATPTVPVTSVSVASNVMTINTSAAHGAVVGQEVIYTKSSNGSYTTRAVVTSVPSSTSLTVALTGANGSATGGNLMVLNVIGSGRGIAIDPGASIGVSIADFEFRNINILGQPGDGFYGLNLELARLENIFSANNGGNGIQINGADDGSGSLESINNVIIACRASGNGKAGILDYGSVSGNLYLAPEALQNYGWGQLVAVAGSGGPLIINPDIEAESVAVASSGTGSNTIGLSLGSVGSVVIGGLINAGGYAPLQILQRTQKVTGTLLSNTAYLSAGGYYTAYILFLSAGLTDIQIDVPLGGSLSGGSQPVTNIPSVLASSTSRIRLGTTILTPTAYASNTVANLSASCVAGDTEFASNGRNSGEAAGSGTGLLVTCNAASHWIAAWSGAAVTQ